MSRKLRSPEVDDRRGAIVRQHIESENDHQLAITVASFAQPRYEVVPTGEVYEGALAVIGFLRETHAAFSDFHFTIEALHHGDDAVIAEVTFMGTHDGTWRGLPPTGRELRYRMCNVFLFEDERLVCERLYFDLATVLRQLGVARDPTTFAGRMEMFFAHPATIVGGLWRRFALRSTPAQ
jgi:steroid delta-isomerase-like uncharacterized protein